MSLELALRAVGFSLLGLAALHAFFPKRFRWREDFAQVSLLNRQIFYVHCAFIGLTLILMGLLCLLCPETLLQPSPLGQLVTAGLSLFWFCRLAAQWLVYDTSLWRGKPFETGMHILFTGLWLTYTTVFASAWWQQWQAR